MEIAFYEILSLARKAYGQQLEPVCQAWNLKRSELDALLFLYNNPGFDRAADIVRGRGMAKSHVSQAVKELEQRGLLRRLPDDTDRRNARLALTEQGRGIAREGKACQTAFFEKIFSGITREDHEHWRRIIRAVSENIQSL